MGPVAVASSVADMTDGGAPIVRLRAPILGHSPAKQEQAQLISPSTICSSWTSSIGALPSIDKGLYSEDAGML